MGLRDDRARKRINSKPDDQHCTGVSSELAAEKQQSSICGWSKLASGKDLKIHQNIKKRFSELGKGPRIDHYL